MAKLNLSLNVISSNAFWAFSSNVFGHIARDNRFLTWVCYYHLLRLPVRYYLLWNMLKTGPTREHELNWKKLSAPLKESIQDSSHTYQKKKKKSPVMEWKNWIALQHIWTIRLTSVGICKTCTNVFVVVFFPILTTTLQVKFMIFHLMICFIT